MNDISILAGNLNPDSFKVDKPFSEKKIDFLEKLSTVLLHDKEARGIPDLVELGYWCASSHIHRFEERIDISEVRLGRGLAFHITPSNIPTNFVYSFLISLLAGNANVVRVPSKDSREKKCILRILSDVMEYYPEIKKDNCFVMYPSTSSVTEELCGMADIRIVWGGDETVRNIKQYMTKPRCVDVMFPDRYSVAIIDGNVVKELGEQELQRLAQNFYNDTYSMDQNACSSPMTLFWINDSSSARELFWNKVAEIVNRKYSIPTIEAVNKYTRLCEDAIEKSDVVSINRIGNILAREEIVLDKLFELSEKRGRCGQFYECAIERFDQLNTFINGKFQTITYFGMQAEKISEWLISNGIKGFDRIVPIGKSMEMDTLWDGMDLIRFMSRVVGVK